MLSVLKKELKRSHIWGVLIASLFAIIASLGLFLSALIGWADNIPQGVIAFLLLWALVYSATSGLLLVIVSIKVILGKSGKVTGEETP